MVLINPNQINPNHPCHGMSCNECETCIFDKDLFIETKKEDMIPNDSCHLCGNLIKNYIGDDRTRFNACCGKTLIECSSFNRPRIIMANVNVGSELKVPDWCPKLGKQQVPFVQETKCLPPPLQLPPPPPTPKNEDNKPLTYSEKKERMKSLPKHVEWGDIEEGCVYVIPKILSQERKVVRVVMKSDSFLRCCEVDEYGKDSKTITSVYPNDLDAVFITKVLKY